MPDTTNAASTNAPTFLQNTAASLHLSDFWKAHTWIFHIVIIVALAFLVHLTVRLVRELSEWMIHKSHAKRNPLGFVTQQPKFITLTRLVVSTITFVVYFLAIGLVLGELVPQFEWTKYLASASVIGLAVGFGSQGFVQDVVIGVTLIFSDALDVGDMVDLSGTIGRVEKIGLRFTKLINFYNQEIFVPNRNIANVSRFPRGGLLAYVDIQIPQKSDQEKVVQTIGRVVRGTWAQFGAIVLSEPVVGSVEVTEAGGWNYLRVKFNIWPGQNSLIETTFRQQMVSSMKTFDPAYADWMVTVTYRAMTGTRK